METRDFGKTPDNKGIQLYTMKNSRGMEAAVINLGAILVSLKVPDAAGKKTDVVLGLERGEDYLHNGSVFGAVVGPHANRIGGAAYELDGVTYQLAPNDNGNNLHSDFAEGYQARIWNAEVLADGVRFSLEDTDGHLGFPGNRTVQITYTLDEENGLQLHYHATSDRRTIFNLTNHSYFNLEGHDAGSIEGHSLWLKAAQYTPVVAGAIPTGEIASVQGTPMDFTTEKVVGKEIHADFTQLQLTGGYDHNYVIDGADGSLQHIATVKAPKSGRVMEVYTTLPGVQFYAGNFIGRQVGKDGTVYDKRHGLCLETQFYPDSIHHDNFPSCVFGPDDAYDSVTVYRFL
ncbi:MAG: galactose mutarotase [Lachnospiraceae bacterium]|nr:galactose mutarotase [Lachnospiraceae bacterium]